MLQNIFIIISYFIITMCIVYSLKGVGIVTECISDHNNTNKRNNCPSLICVLNKKIGSLLYRINSFMTEVPIM